MPGFIPTDELVAVKWVSSATTIPANGVATTVPDFDKWPNDRFLQVAIVGGSPSIDTPRMAPVVSMDAWAGKVGSSRPPWGRALQMLQEILIATYAQGRRYAPHPAVAVVMPTGYQTAHVLSVSPLTQPKRIAADASAYAHFSMDVEIAWAPLDAVIA